MSKKQFKSSASAARAIGTASPRFGFSASLGFGTASSTLSYLTELPDFSSITNSNVVVAFKNLSKRDATTKSKALEDLQALLVDNEKEMEDGALDAWTSIYPRTSIDTSRRVRQLAHTLQGHIASKSGKRIAKRMPSLVGAWLAGTYDTDKAVARAASNALSQVFATPEKRQALWRAYEDQLLEFSQNVFDKETPQTLSDERNISPDEANAKYNRVVTSAVGVLTVLLSDAKEANSKKNETHYTDILQDKKLWEKALSDDAAVRRSIHKLLKNLLQSAHLKSCLDLALLSGIYVTKGADSNQTASADQFVEALHALTIADSTIWTERWKDKKQPASRLKALVKRGSQGAALNYWGTVITLFHSIPTAALPTEPEKAQEVVKAFYSGVTRRDEPRPYVVEGLKAYVQVVSLLASALPEQSCRQLVRDSVLPLFAQYVLPRSENAVWNIASNAAPALVQQMMEDKTLIAMLLEETPILCTDLIREIKLSLPEQAKEYQRSQDELSKAGDRFAKLLAAITSIYSDVPEPIENAAAQLLTAAFAVVMNRNGKPYGAAAVASAVITQCRPLISQSERLSKIVSDFLRDDIANVYVSHSYKQLAAMLSAVEEEEPWFKPAWIASLNAYLAKKPEGHDDMLTQLLICRTTISEEELSHIGSLLAPEILPKVDGVWTGIGDWESITSLLSRSTIASLLFAEPILERVTESLIGAPAVASIALNGLQAISRTCPNTLKRFLSTDSGKKLLPNLLLLSESPDDSTSKAANELIPAVQSLLGSETGSTASGNAVIDVIHEGLISAGPTSVSVDTLVNHAKGLLNSNMVNSADVLLPETTAWSVALHPFLAKRPDSSLAITSPFGGLVFSINDDPTSSSAKPPNRDGEGFSVPLRMAMYTARLCSLTRSTIPRTPQLANLLALTTSLANDQLSIAKPSNLWASDDSEILSEISDFVSASQQLLKNWNENLDSPDLHQITAKSYYLVLAGARFEVERQEARGAPSTNIEDLEMKLKQTRANGNLIQIVSLLYAHQLSLSASPVVMRYCNELVADLTPFDASKLQEVGLRQLVILNTILAYYEDACETIAKPRLSRFISKAVSWLMDEAIEDELVAELYRMMSHLLPLVNDMYGEYWKNILDSIKSNLELVSELPDVNAPALIPSLHAALRLFGVLRRIKSSENAKDEDERNDDVIEAWDDYENEINGSMINCLKVPRKVSDEQHQPLMIFNEVLSREISRIPTNKISNAEELYPQLYSPSPAVQQAAYRLLHRYIPSKQAQISLDAVLEKTSARLPDELLSLILEIPVAADLHDEDFERIAPLQLRGYLLSWLLVFDHFTNASHKVKSDYVDSMKEAGHLGDFLDFAFDFLGHVKGRPLDVTKFDVASYNTTTFEDSPLKDTQWLLTHLYYLCLMHFPTLSKNWWIDCRSRQKVISVESWTAKHIAPLVISTALEAVATWANTQEKAHTSEEPPALAIRINHRASELTAAYPMDDEGQSAVIVVCLPPTFPLHNAKVTSPSKSMAVDERRWNSWLLNSQAIIAFSNNSIVDGLLAWRRNVFGALKGQTECAICYSVVGEDGRVPSKKCRTCRNSFHGGCLFKWFKSSNATSCPLCRESFNYG